LRDDARCYILHLRHPSHARQDACGGQSIPLRTLEDIAVTMLGEIVFVPTRVKKLIDDLQSHESADAKRSKGNSARLRKGIGWN